jgi:hypothetical protein
VLGASLSFLNANLFRISFAYKNAKETVLVLVFPYHPRIFDFLQLLLVVRVHGLRGPVSHRSAGRLGSGCRGLRLGLRLGVLLLAHCHRMGELDSQS